MHIKMSRFVFVIIAMIRFRFVFITNAILKTLSKYIFIVITIIIIITRTIKAETEQGKKREEREEREIYLGMRGHEPLLNYPGFNAFFYTICPGGHQRSQLSPIRSIMEENVLNLETGLAYKR